MAHYEISFVNLSADCNLIDTKRINLSFARFLRIFQLRRQEHAAGTASKTEVEANDFTFLLDLRKISSHAWSIGALVTV